MEESVKIDVVKEKSIFERAIIEAFKQTKVADIYEKLLIAYEELPNYIDEIKKGNEQDNNKKFILNLNILDKINRILERNFININILISKIFNIFLLKDNIPLLSNNPSILINFSNQILSLLDIIKSYDKLNELIKNSLNYIQYLEKNSDKYLSSEQSEIINSIASKLNEKIVSSTYTYFQKNFERDILTLCRGESMEEKEKGLENLNKYFLRLKSLNEQFELLCQYGQDIIKGIINKSNPGLIDTYYKLSYFLISFLYNFIYKIKLSPNEENINENIKKINEQYYILDSMEENIELSENLYVTKFHGKEYHNMKFLDEAIYELDDLKTALLNHTTIFSLCLTMIKCLIFFEKSFKSQFVCFLMLKRLYFIFPKYKNELEELIPNALINLISFDDEVVKESKEPYESFLLYLIQNGEENIRNKIKEILEKKKTAIKQDYLNYENKEKIEKINVEYDTIFISDFNLNIGCPTNIEVAVGDEEEKLIEVKNQNSVLYIAFNLPLYDINFHLIKYCPNINNELSSKDQNEVKVQYEEHKYFYEIFKLEKTQGAKIILFIKNPGIYKVIFDNKYSWFTSKLLRYRCSILKELNGLSMSPSTSNEDIKLESTNKETSENIQDNNKKEEDKKVVEENKSVKITVKFGDNPTMPNINLGDDEDLNNNEELK